MNNTDVEASQIASQIAELTGLTVEKVIAEAKDSIRKNKLLKLQKELMAKLSGTSVDVEEAPIVKKRVSKKKE